MVLDISLYVLCCGLAVNSRGGPTLGCTALVGPHAAYALFAFPVGAVRWPTAWRSSRYFFSSFRLHPMWSEDVRIRVISPSDTPIQGWWIPFRHIGEVVFLYGVELIFRCLFCMSCGEIMCMVEGGVRGRAIYTVVLPSFPFCPSLLIYLSSLVFVGWRPLLWIGRRLYS